MHQLGTRCPIAHTAMKYLLGTLGAVAVIGALSAVPAFGDILFMTGNHPQPNEENILFTSDQTGSTVTGLTNQSDSTVNFSSTTDTLTVSAKGQAKVGASDGLVNDITISTPGTTFDDLILNPENGSGTADVTVKANDGSFTFSYDLSNGNNFLTITTTGGETISSVTVDDTAGFPDLKQPRISGVAGVTTTPEPSTFLMWLVPFLGMAGLAGKKLLAL